MRTQPFEGFVPGLLPDFVSSMDASVIDHINQGPFVPDIIQPVQFAAMRSAARQSPEHKLWFAVMDDALRCVKNGGVQTGNPVTVSRARLVAREEALIWFKDLRSQRVASLTSVCEMFGLDPRRVSRQALKIASGEVDVKIPGGPLSDAAVVNHNTSQMTVTRDWESLAERKRRRDRERKRNA